MEKIIWKIFSRPIPLPLLCFSTFHISSWIKEKIKLDSDNSLTVHVQSLL